MLLVGFFSLKALNSNDFNGSLGEHSNGQSTDQFVTITHREDFSAVKNNKKLLLSLAISTALYGQTTFAADVESEEDDNVIIVTAQKRSERITEVPISISVFPEEAIDQTGIQELRELAEFIPNVSISQGTDFNAKILIRGVGAASRNIGFDTRVGVYLDGVYLGQGPSINQDLVDLERVEVLRGPQGTLFGKNTVAGAISLISKKPHQEFEGKASVNASNFNGLELRASVNFPISDELSAKIAVSSRERDGYITNIFDPSHVPTQLFTGAFDPGTGAPIFVPIDFYIANVINPQFAAIGLPPLTNLTLTSENPPTIKDLNGQDTQSWRAQFRYQPSEDLDINIGFDGLTSDRGAVLDINLTDTFSSALDRFAPAADEVSWNRDNKETRDLFGGSVDITYDMANDYTFKSITAFRNTEIGYANDLDYSAIDFVYLQYDDEYKQTTQEFQFISPDDSDFKYVLGLYYFTQDSETNRDVFNGNAAFFFSSPTSVNYPGTATRNNGDVETTSTALYMSGSYQINELWNLGFGFRYSDEDKDVVWNLDGTFSGVFGIGSTAPGGLVDSRNDTNFAPTLSLNYAFNEDTNGYVKFSTGFKSGGFNLDYITQADLAAGIRFDKETVDSYEIGFKTVAMDNRLSLNAAYFIANYDDYQVNQFFDLGFDPITGTQLTSIRITNAASVETSGLELEAIFKVTDDLAINGSIGTLDATFDDFPGGSSEIDPVTGNRLPLNAAGNKLPGAADLNASLGIQYYSRIESLDSDLLMRLDITHTGESFTSIDNEKSRTITANHPLAVALDLSTAGQTATVPFGHVDAYTLINGRIGLIDGQGDWEVYLWGRNLTDEDQFVDSIRDFFGSLGVTPQAPRTYGIEASYNF